LIASGSTLYYEFLGTHPKIQTDSVNVAE